jgi:hypothetical protein
MRRLLLLIVLLAAGVLVVGYYREWFKFSMSGTDSSTSINVTMDKEKIKEDEQKARENLENVGGKIRDQARDLSKKPQKESTTKDQNNTPQ